MNLGYVGDVNVEIRVELGRTLLPLNRVARIGQGTMIELDKLCGDPVDVLAAGTLIAKGEVVVMEQNFGVRVTEVVEKEGGK